MIKDEFLTDTHTESIHEDYTTERNKPMPNRIHGSLQTKISHLLMSEYEESYDFPNEVSLDTTPPSTPDICIYPVKDLDRKEIKAKETEMPISTIEILSPSQSVEDLADKAWDIYFPKGIKSAWIVVPAFKAIHVLLSNKQELYFNSGTLKDPATGIEISIEKIFERLV